MSCCIILPAYSVLSKCQTVEEQDQMLSAGQIEKQPEVHADAVDTEMAEFGDQDYQAEDMEDIDDEATIDQEEMLAATEGVDGKASRHTSA